MPSTGDNRPTARQPGPTATSSCLSPRALRRPSSPGPRDPWSQGRICLALQWSSGLETGCWRFVSLRLDCGSSESGGQGHPHSALLFQELQSPKHLCRQHPCLKAILLPGPPPKGPSSSGQKRWPCQCPHASTQRWPEHLTTDTHPHRHKVLGDPSIGLHRAWCLPRKGLGDQGGVTSGGRRQSQVLELREGKWAKGAQPRMEMGVTGEGTAPNLRR